MGACLILLLTVFLTTSDRFAVLVAPGGMIISARSFSRGMTAWLEVTVYSSMAVLSVLALSVLALLPGCSPSLPALRP